MPTVLIAGGTGLIGSRLSKMLLEKGYEVLHLSRQKDLQAKFPAYEWNLSKGYVDEAAIRQADFVINLAGAGIADQRWTEARKKLIIDSRVEGIDLLLQAFKTGGHVPKAYLSSAAIGYYGDRGSEWLSEDAAPGTGFLAESCLAWEKGIRKVFDAGIRTVALRIGIVLSTQGGAMEKMMIPLHFYTGTYFGDGQQYYSWIHLDDLCRMFIWAMENPAISGTFNAVAPEPVTNKALTQALAKVMKKTAFLLPAPAAALRLAMGEMAEVVLSSARVSAEKIRKAGFVFRHGILSEALKDLLDRRI